MSEMPEEFSKDLIINSSHPTLAGHFPNNPIIPGVVILDQVIRFWQQESGHTVKSVLNTKFITLLRPDTACTIDYQSKGNGKVNFMIHDEQQKIIARGLFSYVS